MSEVNPFGPIATTVSEEPTGRLRWSEAFGTVPVLQQEWAITTRKHSSDPQTGRAYEPTIEMQTEWRTVPTVQSR